MNEENGAVQPEVTEEEVVEELDSEDEEVSEEESVEELRARLQKAEEIAENQRIRAEKAEKKAKGEKPEAVKSNPDLGSKEIIALMNAKVAEEDIDEVVRYARYQGISVADALKSDVMKATLSIRQEQRTVAEATNTGSSRRGAAKVSDDVLVENARKGKLPDSDSDIERLVRAHMGLK